MKLNFSIPENGDSNKEYFGFGYVIIANDLDLFILAMYTETNNLLVEYPEKKRIRPRENGQIQ